MGARALVRSIGALGMDFGGKIQTWPSARVLAWCSDLFADF